MEIQDAIQLMARRLADFRENAEGWDIHAQKHLDLGTPERAYYHLGYAVALADTLQLLGGKPDA